MDGAGVARRYFDLAEAGDTDGALALFAGVARFVGPMGELPLPDGVRAYLESYATSFPGNRFEITNVFEAGDQVAVEGYWSGRHSGPMVLPDGSSLPPTNRQVRAPFATIFTVRDGRIIEHRGYWDMAGFIAALTG